MLPCLRDSCPSLLFGKCEYAERVDCELPQSWLRHTRLADKIDRQTAIMSDKDSSPTLLLEKWISRVRRAQLAHRFAAKRFALLHYWLGIPSVMLSAIVGGFVFAGWKSGSVQQSSALILGLLSITVAILSALQTFLRLEERSNKHQKADASYCAIKQELEQRQAFSDEDDMNNVCDRIRKQMDYLDKEAPIVAETFWQRARAVMAKQRNP